MHFQLNKTEEYAKWLYTRWYLCGPDWGKDDKLVKVGWTHTRKATMTPVRRLDCMVFSSRGGGRTKIKKDIGGIFSEKFHGKLYLCKIWSLTRRI